MKRIALSLLLALGLVSQASAQCGTDRFDTPFVCLDAATDGHVLRRSGSGVGSVDFGTLNLAASGTVGTSVLGVVNGGTGGATTTAARVSLGAVGVVKVQTFCASGCSTTIAGGGSGTYTPSTGILHAIIECVGGGGAGGSAASTTGNTAGAGGGGSGGYSRKVSTAAAIGASQTVNIGAAGAAAATGNNPGGNGGNTSVGSLCVGNGGTGGGGGNGAGPGGGLGGAGGTVGTGDLTTVGAGGGSGLAASIVTVVPAGGNGGPSHFGGGGIGATAATGTGGASGVYGGGGGGGVAYNGSNVAGGAGNSGLVVITEFTNQ